MYNYKYDKQNLFTEIETLPKQLLDKPLFNYDNERKKGCVIVGMGGSGISGDIILSYVSKYCNIPIYVHRGYSIPLWVTKDYLVIACSHSGNTEETVSAVEQAINKNCVIYVISSKVKGNLMILANKYNLPFLLYNYQGQPRCAIGYIFRRLLTIFQHNRFLDMELDIDKDIDLTYKFMTEYALQLSPDKSCTINPAKALAQKLFGKQIVMIGSDFLEPIARRWKGQFNELSKTLAFLEILPEANHNLLEGILLPYFTHNNTYFIFLKSQFTHPRNIVRIKETDKIIKDHRFKSCIIDTNDVYGDKDKTKSILTELWTLIQLGDYISYYLAMLNRVNPTPVNVIEKFKLSIK